MNIDLDITIKEKLERLSAKVRELRESVSLFAVVQREDADTWDLIIGGENMRTKDNLDLIVRIIRKMFEENEIVKFPRLVLLNSDHPFIVSINKALAVEGRAVKIENTRIDNVFVKNAYLVYSKSVHHSKKVEPNQVEKKDLIIKIKGAITSASGNVKRQD